MTPSCPICGKEMWDNRPKKKTGEFSAKSPDFKCKDKDCEGVIWPPKGGEIPIVPPLPTMESYTDVEAQKQLRIARESIFSSLCNLVGSNREMVSDKSLRVLSEAIMEETEIVIDYIYSDRKNI